MADENKVRTKTESFKETLQAKVAEILGVKVSKQKAWELYKEMCKAPFSFILKTYDEAGKPEIKYGEKHKELELPLAGIGTYKVITTGTADKYSVKGRLYLSSAFDRCIKEHLGFAVEDAEPEAEVEAVDETAEVPTPTDLDLDI